MAPKAIYGLGLFLAGAVLAFKTGDLGMLSAAVTATGSALWFYVKGRSRGFREGNYEATHQEEVDAAWNAGAVLDPADLPSLEHDTSHGWLHPRAKERLAANAAALASDTGLPCMVRQNPGVAFRSDQVDAATDVLQAVRRDSRQEDPAHRDGDTAEDLHRVKHDTDVDLDGKCGEDSGCEICPAGEPCSEPEDATTATVTVPSVTIQVGPNGKELCPECSGTARTAEGASCRACKGLGLKLVA